MICVYENLVVPDAGNANVCPKLTSMAETTAARHQKACAQLSHLPSLADSRVWDSRLVPEMVVFIQVSVSLRGLGSGQC